LDSELSASSSSADDADSYGGRTETRDNLREPPVWLGYAMALAITASAIGLRRWLDVLGEGIVPFALFYPAVLLCTLFGGLGPGLLSLCLCTLAASLLWLKPIGLLAASGYGFVNFGLFVVTSGSIVLIAHLLRSAHTRLRQSELRLSLAQDVGRIGIWELDLKSGDLWWSPMFFEVTGIHRDLPPSIDAFIERIEPADRKYATAALEAARSGQAKLDVQFRFKREDGETIWLAGRAELFRDAHGRPSRLVGINYDATSSRTMASEHSRAHALLETFFASLPGAAYAKDAEGRILLGNPGFAEAVGRSPDEYLGKTDLEFLRDEEHARAIMAHDRSVLSEGVSQQVEEDLILPDGRLTHWISIKTPFGNVEGHPEGLVGMSLDMTERRKAEMRLRFLADEVDHRAKNLLAVVQSIVRLTKSEDVETFRSALEGRLRALARAHSLLAANRWEGANLATLVKEELAPFALGGEDRINISGPSVTLEPNASQALAMILHELAVNAVRHGALSVEAGGLTVSWQLAERGGQTHLSLAWTEANGPPVSAPERQGFGSTAIRGAIQHQLDGAIDCDWAPSGLTCTIDFPLKGHTIADERPASQAAELRPGIARRPREGELNDKRVLILDDEVLLALTMKEMVEKLGCEAIGPANNVESALSLIGEGGPDVAILDVNLSGTSSAPVAQALRGLGIPFIYCTGYPDPVQQIAPDLQAPILSKPADEAELGAALKQAVEG
jgi:PAS domain S-box-containing protein